MSIALVLGGGAPNLTLMSGALAALDDNGVEFDVISTLGAGMLVGLLYAAPKATTRQEELASPRERRQKALAMTRDLGVHDLIYSLFPVNYKVFHKSGAAAELYTRTFRQKVPKFPYGHPRLKQRQAGAGPAIQDRSVFLEWLDDVSYLVNDWIELVLSTLCPSDLTPLSLGLCQPAPWIEEVVDFRALKAYHGEFFMSAYCIDDQKMRMFSKDEIDASVFRACLAMPFIYEPMRLGAKTSIEGSAYDTFNFEDLFVTQGSRPDLLIVSDILGREELLRTPRHLLDAWAISIIVPLVAMARDDLKLFCLEHLRKYPQTTLLRLKYRIPEKHAPSVLDWSKANLETLYEVGYEAGLEFLQTYHEELDARRAFPDRRYPDRDEILSHPRAGRRGDAMEYKKRFIDLVSFRSDRAWIPKALVWPRDPLRPEPGADLTYAQDALPTREAADEYALAAAQDWIAAYGDPTELLAISLAVELDRSISALTLETMSEWQRQIREDSRTLFARVFDLPVEETELEVKIGVGSIEITIQETLSTLLLLLNIYGTIKTAADLCRDLNTAATQVATVAERITRGRVTQIGGLWKRHPQAVDDLVKRHKAGGMPESETRRKRWSDAKDMTEKDDRVDRVA